MTDHLRQIIKFPVTFGLIISFSKIKSYCVNLLIILRVYTAQEHVRFLATCIGHVCDFTMSLTTYYLLLLQDVTDTGNVRDRVKALEMQWRELNLMLDDRQRLGKARTEQLMAYEKLRDQVLAWLQSTENRVTRLEPVAVEMETIKRQIDELKVGLHGVKPNLHSFYFLTSTWF